jgi:Type IV Pilus-assembly protein W
VTGDSPDPSRCGAGGFSILETMIATLLIVLLVVGLLAVCDSAMRLNKSEIAAVEAQGSLRYGLDRVVAAVRMAGAGGLFVTQSVLVRPDPGLPGVVVSGDGDFDDVAGGTVSTISGGSTPIRAGTDVLEVRGVVFSPLFGFDPASGCGSCAGVAPLSVKAVTASGHINDEPVNRPRFSEVDSYTQGVSPENPMFVIAAAADDLHAGCPSAPVGRALPPQPSYVVGKLANPTALAGSGSFGPVDFDDPLARELSTENPNDPAFPGARTLPSPAARAGILDDVLFFVDDSDPEHPTLAQGIRRGARFDVIPLADDVEDLQVAYGVDGLYGSDGRAPDGSLGRLLPPSTNDPDPDVSNRPDGDEWAPNAAGERLFDPTEFQEIHPPPAGFPHDRSAASALCPVLRAVMVSVVVRSHDPDPSYLGPGSLGIRTMNAAFPGAGGPSAAPSARYRRRSRTMKVNLRNFGLDG